MRRREFIARLASTATLVSLRPVYFRREREPYMTLTLPRIGPHLKTNYWGSGDDHAGDRN
jgi:hypothetical protein